MRARDLARVLWDFARVEEPLERCSAIVGLGSYDLRVADRVAELWHQGLAPEVILSGGWGAWTRDRWLRPEAEVFAERVLELGVPRSVIRLEPKSSNTGENIRFVQPMLKAGAIWVTKPQMTRRVRATLDVAGLEPRHRVTCPLYGFDAAMPYENFTEADLIAELVGVHARLRAYPARGFQSPQPPDPAADAAYTELVALGFGTALP